MDQHFEKQEFDGKLGMRLLNCLASVKSCTTLRKSLFFFLRCFRLDFVHNSFKTRILAVISPMTEKIKKSAPIEKLSNGNKV